MSSMRDVCEACPRHHERDGQHFCDAPFDGRRYDPRAATRWLNFAWTGMGEGCPEGRWSLPQAKRVPRTIGWAVKGAGKAARAMLMPDTPESLRRLAICTGDGKRPKCDHYDPEREKCELCGCKSRLKTRLHGEGEACPIGRW